MSRFVFKLEGVLRQRKHLEEQRQRELAVLLARLTQQQGELRTLNDSIEATALDVRQNHMTGRLDMTFLAAHRRYAAAMQRKGLAMVQQMAVVQRQVDEARRALGEAAKGRKVIEKLREREQERWRADGARKEAAEADEIGTQMAFQQRAGDEAFEDQWPEPEAAS